MLAAVVARHWVAVPWRFLGGCVICIAPSVRAWGHHPLGWGGGAPIAEVVVRPQLRR